MKGATALPWVRTIRPPNNNIMIIMGSSQYFLRARMKAQSSFRNDISYFQTLSFKTVVSSFPVLDQAVREGSSSCPHPLPNLGARGACRTGASAAQLA